MRVLRASGYATVPWKNRGGTTREIMVRHQLGHHDDFLFRISLATVDRSGPFSRFDGVDRTIAIVDGGDMVLHAPNGSTTLTDYTAPYSFGGEIDISCELLGGVTTDLNVMTRRSAYRHTMRRVSVTGLRTFDMQADETIIVANGSFEVSARGRDTIGPLDTIAEVAPGDTFEIYADRSAELFVIELTRR